MKNKKPFLFLYLIISLVIIVVASVLSLTIGINLGTDLGGGTQFKISTSKVVNFKQDVKDINSILSENHLSSEKIFVETYNTDEVIVVRIAKKGITNQDVIKQSIIDNLNEENISVGDFNEFSGVITNRQLLYAGITFAVVLVAIFLACLIRYNVWFGLTAIFSIFHTALLAFAVMIITRINISLISLIAIIIAVSLSIFALAFLFERIKEDKAMKHNENLSAYEIVENAKKETIKPLIVALIMFAVFAIAFVFVPVNYVRFIGISLLIALVSVVYTYYFVSVDFHKQLLTIKDVRDKKRLSRNNLQK